MEIRTTTTDWKAMQFDDRKEEISQRWYTFQRRTLAEAWDIGRGLWAIKGEMIHGEWLPYITEIGINRETARRFMLLADSYPDITQLVEFASVDEAFGYCSKINASCQWAGN